MTICILVIAIYFTLGALLALKYFLEWGKHNPPLECFGTMAIVFVIGVVAFVYFAVVHVITQLIRWRKNRDTSR